MKTFNYRLRPTKHQETLLENTLDECRWLYNHLLEERKASWEDQGKSISKYDQMFNFSELKVQRPALNNAHSQVLQNVAVRIDLAFKSFFRRVKSGETPGYPRFRGKDRYNSFTYPQSGFKLAGNVASLSKIGKVRLVLHRPLEGTIKTCCIRRLSSGKWFISFSCEMVANNTVVVPNDSVGIDVGLATFAALSTGEKIDNPKFFRKDEKRLAKSQRKLSSQYKGTPKRAKAKKVVAKVHERIANRRKDFAHQISRNIVSRFNFIAVEDLAVNKMVHNHCLAKSISDAAWNQFTSYLKYKAAWAGSQYIEVNPAYTSQNCSSCGHRQKMSLDKRVYICPCCNLQLDRDHNAALNILALGLQSIN